MTHRCVAHGTVLLDLCRWLGWPNNMQAVVSLYTSLISKAEAGGVGLVRGLATDIANYTPREPFAFSKRLGTLSAADLTAKCREAPGCCVAVNLGGEPRLTSAQCCCSCVRTLLPPRDVFPHMMFCRCSQGAVPVARQSECAQRPLLRVEPGV